MHQKTKQDISDDVTCNSSGNVPFAKVLESNLSRRSLLKGGLAGATTTFFATGAASALAKNRGAKVGFTPVTVADGTGPWPSISPDYEWDVLIPWGEPLEPDGPEYRYPPNSSDQENR